ncbi:MAG: Spy/CpxP family protein refolding chaperone [Haliea sp.]|nr:Spy/CpxP family protein refolding chaperone [Haliea sp.]MDP4918488.1 Spy/CpxP family protein refolding chaperone [Haliea sp.]MDP5065028.1 Spy/CpxP family protein refolding chaperone [Haliea sp.]
MKTLTDFVPRRGRIALALAAIISVAPAFAAPERGNPERMLERLTQRLELTKEQQSSIGELLQATQAEGAADQRRMQEIREALRAQGDNFDAASSEALTAEMGEITARTSYRRAETRSLLRAQLEEAQRARLDTMEKQRSEQGASQGKR